MQRDQLAAASTVVAAPDTPRRSAPTPVKVELVPVDAWRHLKRHTHEMAVGVGDVGRLLLPRLRVNISGLNPEATYWVVLALHPMMQMQWTFEGGKWIPTKTAEDETATNRALYIHPNSPMMGSGWTSHTVSFQEVRLRHSDRQSGHLRVQLSHKYLPHILIFEGSPENWVCCKFPLPDAEFIAVKTYRNTLMASFKSNRHKKQLEKPDMSYTKCTSTTQTELESPANQAEFPSCWAPSQVLTSSSPAYLLNGDAYQQLPNVCNAQDGRLVYLQSPISRPNSIVGNPASSGSHFIHHSQMPTWNNKTVLSTELTNGWPKKLAEKEYQLPITPDEPPEANLPFQGVGDIDPTGLSSLDMQLCGPPPPLIPIREHLPSLFFTIQEESPLPITPLKEQNYRISSAANNRDNECQPLLWKDASDKRYYLQQRLSNRHIPYPTQNNQGVEKSSFDVHATLPHSASYNPCINVQGTTHIIEQLRPDGNGNTFQQASSFPVTYSNTIQWTMPSDFYCQENLTHCAEGSHRDNHIMCNKTRALYKPNYERCKDIQASCTDALPSSVSASGHSLTTRCTLDNPSAPLQHHSTNKTFNSDPKVTFNNSGISSFFPCEKLYSPSLHMYTGQLIDRQHFQSVERKRSSLEVVKSGTIIDPILII